MSTGHSSPIKKWLSRVAVAMVATLPAVLSAPADVLACSGEPFDPKRADAIVEGWVTGFTLRRDLMPATSSPKDSPLIPAEVTLRVEQALLGDPPPTIVFIDSGSVAPGPNGEVRYIAGGGRCGILRGDPTGTYALIVFTRDAADAWKAHAIQGAAFGAGPGAPNIARFRDYLRDQLRPTAMPAVGAGGAKGLLAGYLPAAILPLLGITGAAALARLLLLARPARRVAFTGATKGHLPR